MNIAHLLRRSALLYPGQAAVLHGERASVSYTHLTLPTIYSV